MTNEEIAKRLAIKIEDAHWETSNPITMGELQDYACGIIGEALNSQSSQIEALKAEVERLKLRNSNLNKCECYPPNPLENTSDAIRQNQKAEIVSLRSALKVAWDALEFTLGREVFPQGVTEADKETEAFTKVKLAMKTLRPPSGRNPKGE